VRRIERFDQRVDKLWLEAGRQFRFINDRSSAYLNYRYLDRRAGNFAAVVAEAGDRLLAYVVFTSRGAVGQIADALVHPDSLSALEPPLVYALDALASRGCNVAEYWRSTYHPYGSVLDRLAFDGRVRKHAFMFRRMGDTSDRYAFFADERVPIHLTAGDGDLV
jgi:hypothetical protein